jgi:hypothetical protein
MQGSKSSLETLAQDGPTADKSPVLSDAAYLPPQKRQKKQLILGGWACFFATKCVAALPVVSEVRYECL